MPTHYFSIIYRVIISVFALLVVSLLLFLLMRDPDQISVISQVVLGDGASPEAYEKWERARGLHDPVLVQYWNWFTDILHWDLGESYITGIALEETISTTFPITLELGHPGVVAGSRYWITTRRAVSAQPWTVDRSLDEGWLAYLESAVPIFWTGLLLILFFAVRARMVSARRVYTDFGWSDTAPKIHRLAGFCDGFLLCCHS